MNVSESGEPDVTAAAVAEINTIHDIAARFDVHVQTVRRWIKTGEIGHVKVGKYYYVTADQLATFIDDRRHDV